MFGRSRIVFDGCFAAGVIVGLARDDRSHVEIIGGGRRRCLPLQSGRSPWIHAGHRAVAQIDQGAVEGIRQDTSGRGDLRRECVGPLGPQEGVGIPPRGQEGDLHPEGPGPRELPGAVHPPPAARAGVPEGIPRRHVEQRLGALGRLLAGGVGVEERHDLLAVAAEQAQLRGRERRPQGGHRLAEAVLVGGGNTFHLLKYLYDTGLVWAIRERVLGGVPYMGWSAGSNVACPTIKTTNDMPVVEPSRFDAMRLVPFQINPHYTDAVIPNHGGETRAQRLAEFTKSKPGIYVVGLREGSAVQVANRTTTLLGPHSARIFYNDDEAIERAPGASLEFLWGART